MISEIRELTHTENIIHETHSEDNDRNSSDQCKYLLYSKYSISCDSEDSRDIRRMPPFDQALISQFLGQTD